MTVVVEERTYPINDDKPVFVTHRYPNSNWEIEGSFLIVSGRTDVTYYRPIALNKIEKWYTIID